MTRYLKPTAVVSTCVIAMTLVTLPPGRVMAEDKDKKVHQQDRAYGDRDKGELAHKGELFSANRLIGTRVTTTDGQTPGRIDDLILDAKFGADQRSERGDEKAHDRKAHQAGATRISYAIVSVGGVLGMGGKLVAVPWQQVKYTPGQDSARLELSKARLDEAQALQREDWDHMGDPQWRARQDEFYRTQATDGTRRVEAYRTGNYDRADELDRQRQTNLDTNLTIDQRRSDNLDRQRHRNNNAQAGTDRHDEFRGGGVTAPDANDDSTRAGLIDQWNERDRDVQATDRTYRTGDAERGTVHAVERTDRYSTRRASDLIGMDVVDRNGKKIGQLDDLVIDNQSGQVHYAALAYGGMLGINQKRSVVPLNTLAVDTQKQQIGFSGDEQRLEATRLPNDRVAGFIDSQDFRSRIDAEYRSDTQARGRQFLSTSATSGQTARAWRNDDTYNRNYDAAREVTVRGTVERVGSFYPEAQSAQGLTLQVRTDEGRTETVHAGPRDAMRDLQLDVNRGDEVTVVGSKVNIDGREVIMARQIRTSDRTVDVRSNRGEPQWDDRGARRADANRMD